MKPTQNLNSMKHLNWKNVSLAFGIVAFLGCGETTTKEEVVPQIETRSCMELSLEERGDPCNCVNENLEAMKGLVESIESTSSISAEEINLQISEMMLPCMKPTGDAECDREYSRAMGQCESFVALTEVMSEVKEVVQERINQEARRNQPRDFEGARGATEILDKLKGS